MTFLFLILYEYKMRLNKQTKSDAVFRTKISLTFHFVLRVETQKWRMKKGTVSEYVACNSHTKDNHLSLSISTSISHPDLDASSLALMDLVIIIIILKELLKRVESSEVMLLLLLQGKRVCWRLLEVSIWWEGEMWCVCSIVPLFMTLGV